MAAVCDFGVELVDHPPYSPDLAPSEYFLFLNMKKKLAETQYTDTDTHIHTTYAHKHTLELWENDKSTINYHHVTVKCYVYILYFYVE